MKKIICLVVCFVFILTSGFSIAYADNGKKSNGNDMKYWQDQLKELYKDKENKKDVNKMKEYIKQIVDLKRKANINVNIIFINGIELETDVPPVIKSGRALLPVRAITAALGAEVKWDENTRVATITKGDIKIEIKLDSNKVLVNGKEYILDVPARNEKGRIVVSVRLIAELFNMNVEWDGDTGSIIIEDNDDDKDSKKYRYEAEKAVLSNGATISNNLSGYSGSGFIGGFWNLGASVTFSVYASSASEYDVSLRYSNATGSPRTLSVYVNGTKVKQTTMSSLASWNTWSDSKERLVLNSGNNTIAYKFEATDNGYVNLDYITLSKVVKSN